MSTEVSLFCANVPLGCWEDMGDPVECVIILANPPFLRLCGVVRHCRVFRLGWAWVAVFGGVDVVYCRESIRDAFFVDPVL